MNDRTLVLLKPNVFPQDLPIPRQEEQLEWLKKVSPACREILRRYEEAGLQIIACMAVILLEDEFIALYEQHAGKSFFSLFFEAYVRHWVMPICLEGKNAIAVVRRLHGPPNPAKAPPGTMRGDFGSKALCGKFYSPDNAVHGSDSPGRALREIGIFFPWLVQ